MLFNSYIFVLAFLPACIIVYFLLNQKGWYKAALGWLLGMSLVFYAYNHISYLLILVGSILVNWLFSRWMPRLSQKKKKLILSIGILLNISVIFYFKYFNFFIDNMNFAFGSSFVVEKILLPLGISFYTFQQVSYLVDSYRGDTKEYNFLEYAVFVSFFPQLVAGPIVLHDEIIPQLRDINKKKWNQMNLANGLYVFAIGLIKKIIIADTFGNAVNWGFNNQEILSSLEIILIMLFYTFQIYFDFSAYSDMAIGIGKMFNIELPINFNSPYKSYSIVEFWQRWHMTLTRFLRKYVYFPLGGSKKGKVCTYINVFVVFLISGIWHGANWTFIIWGMIHGIANVLNRLFKKTWDNCNVVFRWLCTFAFVNITWLIFRADSVKEALILIKRMVILDSFTISNELTTQFELQEFSLAAGLFRPLGLLVYKIDHFWMWIFILASLFCCLNFKNLHEKEFKPTLIRALTTIVCLIWAVVSFTGITTFLYFNF